MLAVAFRMCSGSIIWNYNMYESGLTIDFGKLFRALAVKFDVPLEA